MKTNSQLNRTTHPLAPGKYRVTYESDFHGLCALYQGEMMVTTTQWMLVMDWIRGPDGTEKPVQTIRLPDDCPYQVAPQWSQTTIILNHAVELPHPSPIPSAVYPPRKTAPKS